MRLVAWISARSRDAVLTGYTQAGVDLLGADPTDPDQAVAELLAWLADTDQRWLIVLDDLHDPEDMRGLWPPTNQQGRMVVTTRRRDPSLASTDRDLLDVDVFTRAEALGYLQAKLADHPRLREGAEDLAAAVGFLPLALAQAVAYLATRGVTCRQYCDQLADQRHTQPEPAELRDDHEPTVLATSALLAELADTLAPVGLAKPVMALASLLDPDGIPLAVFTTKRALRFLASVVGRWVDGEDVRGALCVLERLGLASLDQQTALPVLRVHPLVQSASRLSAAHQAPEQVFLGVGAVAEALLEVWPDVERYTGLAQMLRANTDVLHSKAELLLWLTSAYAVLVRAGRSLGGAGLAANARDYFQRLCAAAVEHLGSDDHDTLIIRGELAHWRGHAGDLAGAVRDGEQLVDDYQRVLGPDHPETLATRGNLVSARGQQDPVAAIRDGEQLLADYQRVLSLDHPDALILREHLARWRGQTGDVAGAIRETEEVLADRRRVSGLNHPHTLITCGDLAYWRGEAGDPAGAAQVFKRLLDDFLRVLGPDHPDTRIARSNLTYWRARASEGPDGQDQTRD